MATKVSILCRLVAKLYDAEFTVVDSITSVAIAGAVITVSGVNATTNASGIATISSLKRGTYNFAIAQADYEPFTGSFVAG